MNDINSYQNYANKMRELFANFKTENVCWQNIVRLGCCISKDVQTKNVDILIVGINPSFPFKKDKQTEEERRLEQEREQEMLKYGYPTFKETMSNLKGAGSYWHAINRYVKDLPKDIVVEHLDLFALRNTDQKLITTFKEEKEVDGSHIMQDFLLKQIFYAQDLIELIRPRLIIVSNKSLPAYFGYLPEYEWMGYKFDNVESVLFDSKSKKVLAEVHGFRRNGIVHTSSLSNGTKFLFTRYQANGCPKEQQIVSTDIMRILKTTQEAK